MNGYFLDTLNVNTKDGKTVLTADFDTFEAAETAAQQRLLNGYKNVVILKPVATVELPKEHFKTTHIA